MRRPNTRDTSAAIALAGVVAAICWFFGVDVWHAILLGCAVTVATLAGLGSGLTQGALEVSWRPRRESKASGSRSDILSLSHSLRSSWGTVSATADRRLILIARRRLALEGLDLQNPEHRRAIEARLGPGVYRALTRATRGRLSLRSLVGCLDLLDALNPNHYPLPQMRSRWPTLKLAARRKEPHA